MWQKKTRKFVGILFIVAGVLCFFVSYLYQRMPDTHWEYLCAAGIICGLVGVLHILRERSSIPKWAVCGIHAAAGAMLLSFVIIIGSIGGYGGRQDIQACDAVIILGAGLNGEEITPSLQHRLDAAMELLASLPDDIPVVVTGGQGRDETIPEGEAMEKYLVQKGVPAQRIMKEVKATSTYENFLFSREMLMQAGNPAASVTVVTNNFHMRRAAMLAERTGFDRVYCYSAPLDNYLKPTYYLREYFATIKSWMLDR